MSSWRRIALAGTLVVAAGACAPAAATGGSAPPSAAAPRAIAPAPPTPTTTPLTPGSGSGDAGVRPVRPVEQPVPIGGAPATVPAPSPPVHVELPTIGVDSGLEVLARDASGQLGAPVDFATAGWYAAGVEPGQPGPAVVAGHRDTTSGPAVFARLGDLAVGDPVLVTRADGSTLTFRVTGSDQAAKDAFPTAQVYGPVGHPELRLITCGGDFDRRTGHYVDNVIVYAELV